MMADNAVGKDLYVLIHQQDIEDEHLELVTRARMLADELGIGVRCIGIGQAQEKTVDALAVYGADAVCFLDSPLLTTYSAASSVYYMEALAKVMEGERPREIFCSDSLAGRDLACRLAARMKSGLVTGCVDLSLDAEGAIVHEKPAYRGRINSTFSGTHAVPDITTVKPGALEKTPCEMKKSPEIQVINPELDSIRSLLETLGTFMADPGEIGLDEAGIIVTGGRGMGSAESFKLLYTLAGLIGATVAGSLGAVDEGWVPRSKLVGQTGTTVKPKLYIACGVSGSIYHLMGMRDSKAIIAINKDRYAPIFKYADFGIVGDAMAVLPLIINCLETRDASGKRQ